MMPKLLECRNLTMMTAANAARRVRAIGGKHSAQMNDMNVQAISPVTRLHNSKIPVEIITCGLRSTLTSMRGNANRALYALDILRKNAGILFENHMIITWADGERIENSIPTSISRLLQSRAKTPKRRRAPRARGHLSGVPERRAHNRVRVRRIHTATNAIFAEKTVQMLVQRAKFTHLRPGGGSNRINNKTASQFIQF